MKKIYLIAVFVFLCGQNALADDFPKLKEGLWEATTKYEKAPPGMPLDLMAAMKIQHCIDDATQEKMLAEANEGTDCEKPNFKKNGKEYTATVKCKADGHNTVMNMRTIFNSETSVTSHIKMQSDNMPEIAMVGENKYVGPCPSGMNPGETKITGMPSMRGINLEGFFNQ